MSKGPISNRNVSSTYIAPLQTKNTISKTVLDGLVKAVGGAPVPHGSTVPNPIATKMVEPIITGTKATSYKITSSLLTHIITSSFTNLTSTKETSTSKLVTPALVTDVDSQLDFLTPSGKRIFRKRAVKPSTKAKKKCNVN